MHKTILILLTVASNAAMADWIPVGNNTSFTMYADPASIRKEDKRVKMWALTDFKTVNTTTDAKEYRSMKVQSEYDCQAVQSRLLEFSAYSANMGEGEMILNKAGLGKWKPVLPGSVIESFWNMACGKP